MSTSAHLRDTQIWTRATYISWPLSLTLSLPPSPPSRFLSPPPLSLSLPPSLSLSHAADHHHLSFRLESSSKFVTSIQSTGSLIASTSSSLSAAAGSDSVAFPLFDQFFVVRPHMPRQPPLRVRLAPVILIIHKHKQTQIRTNNII
jgi:hypothetical protein